MSTCTLPTPPTFDPTQWQLEQPAPAGYRGTKFDFAVVAELIQVDEENNTVTLMGTTLEVVNLYPTGDERGNHPIYFEVAGRTYHYVFGLWVGRVTIDVEVSASFGNRLSVMFPSTVEELRQALATVVSDAA